MTGWPRSANFVGQQRLTEGDGYQVGETRGKKHTLANAA